MFLIKLDPLHNTFWLCTIKFFDYFSCKMSLKFRFYCHCRTIFFYWIYCAGATELQTSSMIPTKKIYLKVFVPSSCPLLKNLFTMQYKIFFFSQIWKRTRFFAIKYLTTHSFICSTFTYHYCSTWNIFFSI